MATDKEDCKMLEEMASRMKEKGMEEDAEKLSCIVKKMEGGESDGLGESLKGRLLSEIEDKS